MLIYKTVTLTYHFFRLRGIKSLRNNIDEKSKDYKENINQVVTITDGDDIDSLNHKSRESIKEIVSMYDEISYLKLFNITYYSAMFVVTLIMTFVIGITVMIFGVSLIPIVKAVIGVELFLCFVELYFGYKERMEANKKVLRK